MRQRASIRKLSLMAWTQVRSSSRRSLDELALAPDSTQPLFPCEDCTFIDQFITPASRKKVRSRVAGTPSAQEPTLPRHTDHAGLACCSTVIGRMKENVEPNRT